MAGSVTGTPLLELETTLGGKDFNVTVAKGTNRQFLLMQIFMADGIAVEDYSGASGAVITHPTLNGVAHDDFFANFFRFTTYATPCSVMVRQWGWMEASLQEAKCSIGDDIVRPIAGLTVDETNYAAELHSVWAGVTLKDVIQWTDPDQTSPDGHRMNYQYYTGRSAGETLVTMPYGISLLYESSYEISEKPVVALVSHLDSSRVFTPHTSDPIEVLDNVASPNDGSLELGVWLAHAPADTVASKPSRVYGVFDSQVEGWTQFILTQMSHQNPINQTTGVAIGQRPNTRSIDARTIADAYNRGAPEQPDYEFSSRKFYQEPPETP